MLKRKVTSPKSASRPSHRNGKPAKAPAAPLRRRFVISSKAIKPEALKGKSPETAAPASKQSEKQPAAKLAAGKQPANGQAPVATVSLGSVDLSETIKTLLHLAQE